MVNDQEEGFWTYEKPDVVPNCAVLLGDAGIEWFKSSSRHFWWGRVLNG